MGVSDPNSSAGQKGLVDPAQFARANQSIQMACQNLVDPACTQSQVHKDLSFFLFQCFWLGIWLRTQMQKLKLRYHMTGNYTVLIRKSVQNWGLMVKQTGGQEPNIYIIELWFGCLTFLSMMILLKQRRSYCYSLQVWSSWLSATTWQYASTLDQST